jgi:hypothetical protein
MDITILPKQEIIKMLKWKCHHGHSGLAHPTCYTKYKDLFQEKTAYWDIESTGLSANFDYILSYCFIDEDGRSYGRALGRDEVLNKNILDKNLVFELCEDIRKFSSVWVWYGKDTGGRFGGRHDTRFTRTRCLKFNAPFPRYGEGIYISDGYDIAKNKLKLHSNRLEAVCNFLKIPCKQHRLDSDKWIAARLGDKEALSFVWKHNQEDSIALKRVMNKISEFVKPTKTSI